ncbi:hypothetical protein H4582DRAFT_1391244 [Lactarius indigo]|nr:hypothetical protein H4582DRAFT_1391244 [Lactarius indigo]
MFVFSSPNSAKAWSTPRSAIHTDLDNLKSAIGHHNSGAHDFEVLNGIADRRANLKLVWHGKTPFPTRSNLYRAPLPTPPNGYGSTETLFGMQVRAAPITSTSAEVANNTRIAALAVSAYDYILTLPAEYRFYRAFYRNNYRLNTNLVLFVLIRYVSIFVIVLGAIGYWSTFSPDSCRGFYLLPVSARVIQSMVSQAILGLRTYCISRKNSTVGIVLLSSYIIAAVFQWVASIYHRVPVTVDGSCGAATTRPTHFFSPWLFYLAAMLYDFLTLSISMGYLFKLHSSSPFTSRLVKMMIYDGLGYFVALTVVNTVNAILAPFAGLFTWVMSQRILIHLQDAAEKRPRPTPSPIVRPPNLNLNAQGVVRPRSDGHKDTDNSFMGSTCFSSEPIQAHVERSVVVTVGSLTPPPTSSSCDESSRAPTVKWNEGLVSR